MDKEIQHTTLSIRRFDPFRNTEPYFIEYLLDYRRNDQLLDLFEKIKNEIDPTFSYRRSCRHGICGSCTVKVNGKPVLACRTPVRELTAEFGPLLTITPLKETQVIHDLVVQMDDFWASHKQITPYLQPQSYNSQPQNVQHDKVKPITSEFEYKNTLFFDSSAASIADADYCIQCGACFYVCPVVSVQPNFLGPSALTKAYRFINDPRDTDPQRLNIVSQPGSGVWECIKCLKCTEVCPKHIDPFSKIGRLHSQAIKSDTKVTGPRIRHTKGFQLDLLLNGVLNEFPLAIYALRLSFIKMAVRGIRMILHGKVVFNPFQPRSKGHKHIRKIMRNSE